MSDYCYSPQTTEHIIARAHSMDKMLELAGADRVYATRAEQGMAWYEARLQCLGCASAAQCRVWLMQAATAGNLQVPDFCPNHSFIRACNAARS